jgi:hypothetical protein
MTASAFFAAVKASSVNGTPVASMEAYTRGKFQSISEKKTREASDIENRRKKTYSAERVILEVESDVAAMFLDDAENL